MKERFDLESELIKGAGGVFEVQLDDELIFSKKALGRFPDPGEVEDEIAKRRAA